MHEMLTILADVHGVCLSCGSSRPHSAKMAKQIKMLCEVNTLGGPWYIVLDVGPDPPTERDRGPLFNFGTPLISSEWPKLDT